MAALCKGLTDAGHDTWFLTEKSGVSLAASAGARPIALAGDIKSTLTDLLSSGSKASGGSAMTEALSSVAKACTADWMRSFLEVASGCDAILAAGLPMYVALSVADPIAFCTTRRARGTTIECEGQGAGAAGAKPEVLYLQPTG